MKHHTLVLALVCAVSAASAVQIRGLHQGRSAGRSASLDPVAATMGLTGDDDAPSGENLGVDLDSYARRPLLPARSRVGGAARGTMRFAEQAQSADAGGTAERLFPSLSSAASSIASSTVQLAVASSPVASMAASTPLGQLATKSTSNTVEKAVATAATSALPKREDPCQSGAPPPSCPARGKDCPLSLDGRPCSGKGDCDAECGWRRGGGRIQR